MLFDAFGTLVELDDFYGRLQRGFAPQYEIPLDAMRRAAHCEMRHYMKHSLRAQQADQCEKLRHQCAQVLADALRAENPNWDFAPEFSYRVLDASIVFRAFPETREVLQQLKERQFPLAVLSNWDGRLSQVLASLGLSEFFEFIASSAHAGYEKPDARFFDFGLAKILAIHPQIAPDDCFYIGDHWQKDVIPSRAAGMRALWLRRNERDFTSGEHPDRCDEVPVLHSLHDLLSLRLTTEISENHEKKCERGALRVLDFPQNFSL